MRKWPKHLLATLLLGFAAAGCPQLLDDDFSSTPPGDAATGGVGGVGGCQ